MARHPVKRPCSSPPSHRSRPSGRVVSLLVSAAELAVIRHHGSPRDIDLTYGELVVRDETRGRLDGPLRETYLRGSIEATSPDVWETEIGWSTFRTRDRLRSGPGQG